MDFWFALCCFQNPYMVSNIIRYENRIKDDDCSEAFGIPIIVSCMGVGDCWRVMVLMRLLANTKVPEPTEDARYLLHSRYIIRE